MYKKTLAILTLIGAPVALATVRATTAASVSPGDIALTAQLYDPSGSLYDGPIKIRFAQTSPGVTRSWGPYSATCVNGVTSDLHLLNGFDHTEEGSVEFWMPNLLGAIGASDVFYLDADDGAKAGANFKASTPGPGGEYPVVLRRLKITPAPLYGKVVVSSTQGVHPGITLNVADVGFYPMALADTYINSFGLSYGVATKLYSWSLAPSAALFVETSDGWSSAETDVNRGGSESIELFNEGTIRVDFDPTTYPDVVEVIIFEAGTHVPFDPTPFSPTWAPSQAMFHIEGGSAVFGEIDYAGVENQRHFNAVHSGSYVVELWTDSGIHSALPAPSFSSTAVVAGGQLTVITAP